MSLIRNISVTRIAAVAITLGSACSGTPDEDRTFVYRSSVTVEGECDVEETRCRFTRSALTFRDSDGDVATGSASEVSFDFTLQVAETECGGVVIPAEPTRLDNFELIEPLQLVLTDGSSLQLVPEVAIRMGEACYEENGRWEGVAGSLRGRSGAYRWVDDSLQIELSLSGL